MPTCPVTFPGDPPESRWAGNAWPFKQGLCRWALQGEADAVNQGNRMAKAKSPKRLSPDPAEQPELDFHQDPAASDGLDRWRRQREQELSELARNNGLPLGKACRVELVGEVILEGPLLLAHDELFQHHLDRNPGLRLRIGRCTFTPREIVTVVRLDS